MRNPDLLRESNFTDRKQQSQILATLDDNHDIIVLPRERLEELRSRLRIEQASAKYELRKSAVLFGATLTFTLSLAIGCFVVLLSPRSPTTSQNWAIGTLTSLAAFLFGRASKSRNS
jgi:hypothetical protein